MANYSFGPYTLYDYQQRIIELLRSEIIRLRASGKPPHIILQAPCGAGKGLLVAALASLTRDKGGTFLFAVSGRTLVSQVSHKFAECGIPHGILMALSHQGIEHDHGVHIDNRYIANHPDFMRQLPVVVASRDTYGSRVFSRQTMEKLKPDIVCVDECRMGHSGRVYRSLLSENKDSVIIGFDATPAKGTGHGFGDLYQSLIHGTTYKELLQQGFLVPAVCFGPREVDFSGVQIGINGEYVQEQASARFDKDELIGDIIRDWKALAHNRPTIVFAQSVQHSVHIAEMFNANGIIAEHLEAKTPLSVRKRVYSGITDGSVQVVTNYGVLKYGVDIPAAGCVILACKMASLPSYIQAVGRGFRACKSVFWENGGPKRDAIIIDHAGNIKDHGWPTEDRFWTLNPDCTVQEETEKSRQQEDKEPVMMSCSICGAEWEPKTGSHCPGCGYQKPKIGKRPNFNGQKLARIRKSQVKSSVPNTKQKTWMTCLGIAGAKNLSYAQAVRIFESKTGSRFSECKVSPVADRSKAYELVGTLWPGFRSRGRRIKK